MSLSAEPYLTPTAHPISVGELTPFLRWAGGKRGLLKKLLGASPTFEGKYLEPFLGSGTLFLEMLRRGHDCVVADQNLDLIETWKVLRDQPSELIATLEKFEVSKDFYYEVRNWDRESEFYGIRTEVERAARFLYLNRYGFNGLYRVNSSGLYNVPWGSNGSPKQTNAKLLHSISEHLNGSMGPAPEIMHADFNDVMNLASEGDFIYLDPPYDPVTETASFTSYQAIGFDRNDQSRLAEASFLATLNGTFVLASNSNTAFIRDVYSRYGRFELEELDVRRSISATSTSRKPAKELLIKNFVFE